jgi:hypothetical protein
MIATVVSGTGNVGRPGIEVTVEATDEGDNRSAGGNPAVGR